MPFAVPDGQQDTAAVDIAQPGQQVHGFVARHVLCLIEYDRQVGTNIVRQFPDARNATRHDDLAEIRQFGRMRLGTDEQDAGLAVREIEFS